MTRPRSLGRGLDALIGTPARTSASGMRTVSISELKPGRFQPRTRFNDEDIDGLARSLTDSGMMQPIIVRPAADGMMEIVAGERRWRAAQRARLHDVPVIVKDMSDREALEHGLVENLQREDLGPVEEAAGYRRLNEEFALTQEDMAVLVGKSRVHVANTLRLLQLPEPVRKLINEGELSAGHGRALLGTRQPEALAARILKEGLSVRETEALVRNHRQRGSGSRSTRSVDPDVRALERRLGEATGLKVAITSKGERGKLTLTYRTLQQLDDIIARLERGAILADNRQTEEAS
ncbi:MAG: ParB/RepB/Spo0J family partition protein [bacterium]|nr:ParB/RepB/Spo0J family partition protein [bacterium]